MVRIDTQYFPTKPSPLDPLARRGMIFATIRLAVLIEPSATDDGKAAIAEAVHDLEEHVKTSLVDAMPAPLQRVA